jgi:hypothetical protein
MYLSYGFHGPARGMDLPTREAKVGPTPRGAAPPPCRAPRPPLGVSQSRAAAAVRALRERRANSRPARKIAELWKQLCWLDAEAARAGGPHLLGAQLTLADLTWSAAAGPQPQPQPQPPAHRADKP